MKWVDISTTLKNLVADLAVDDLGASVSPFLVPFAQDSNRRVHPKGLDLVLRTIGTEHLGSERRYDANNVEINIVRERLTIQLFCEGINGGEDALIALGNIKTRIRREASLQMLISAGLGLVSTGSVVPVQMQHGGRVLDARTMDLRFNVDLADHDLSTASQWIEMITIEGFRGSDRTYTEEKSR